MTDDLRGDAAITEPPGGSLCTAHVTRLMEHSYLVTCSTSRQSVSLTSQSERTANYVHRDLVLSHVQLSISLSLIELV